MLIIPAPFALQMSAHARAWYPGECCGLLCSALDSLVVSRVLCLDNLQDKYHARFPEDFPRTSRDAFKLDERRYAREVQEAPARGEQVIAIFHSHIDCGAYFSREDILMAAPFGSPNEPHLWHVVLDCQPGPRVQGAKAYHWNGQTFAEQLLPDFPADPA